MLCYACDAEATGSCPRCGNSYCAAHGAQPGGGSLCAACLDPLGAMPSSTVFRASLFALFVASVLALWLLVRPPGQRGQTEEASAPLPTQAPLSTPLPATPSAVSTPAPGQPPAGSPSPTGAPATSPAPSATETPQPTQPPPAAEYTVREGDTWYSIAAEFGVDANDLAAANGRTLDDFVVIGETLVIPR